MISSNPEPFFFFGLSESGLAACTESFAMVANESRLAGDSESVKGRTMSAESVRCNRRVSLGFVRLRARREGRAGLAVAESMAGTTAVAVSCFVNALSASSSFSVFGDAKPKTICATASVASVESVYFSLKCFKNSIIFRTFADASAKTQKRASVRVYVRFFSA